MRTLITVLIVIALVSGVLLALLRPTDDGLGAYPHAYLAAPGYDPALITVLPGPFATPPPPPEGSLLAWQCDDPAFQDEAGRPWLFPMAAGTDLAEPPLHPRLKRAPRLDDCRPFRTAEGQAQLQIYSDRNRP
jgi:hypothetical protein